MAGEFQSTFNEADPRAERQTELEDLRRQLAEAKALDPLKDVRDKLKEMDAPTRRRATRRCPIRTRRSRRPCSRRRRLLPRTRLWSPRAITPPWPGPCTTMKRARPVTAAAAPVDPRLTPNRAGAGARPAATTHLCRSPERTARRRGQRRLSDGTDRMSRTQQDEDDIEASRAPSSSI